MARRLLCLLERMPRGEEVLDRGVVERLGERLPLALLGADGLGHQAFALVGELDHTVCPPPQDGREQQCRGRDPRQVAGLDEQEPRRLRLRSGRMREALAEIRGDRPGPGDGGDRRSETKGGGDGNEEVREPGLGERATGERGQRGHCRDVDRRGRQREPLGDGPDVDPGEHSRAPGGEDHERDRERCAGRVRMLDSLSGGDQRDRRQAQPGDEALALLRGVVLGL